MNLIDALDRTIVEHLEFDGRCSMQDLSDLTGLSRSAVFARVKRLENDGVIQRYTVKLDRKKMGLELKAFCSVNLKLHERAALEEFEHDIGSFKEVRSCYHLTGISDYMLEINVPDMDHYHRFITRKLAALDNISQVKSMFVMNEIIEK
ncbi:MAG: Lrp/AsnC family transcriptional regulator [Flavobacteriales bacterium]|nr:Lrp/AsnC family transcriptional regulator [Flavobacteriales bacterium]